jgi:tryptophanyl-tRNA synthetase
MVKKIALTGIKPTGMPHIGNYLGMIKPALDLVETYQALYFIADYHALTSLRNPESLNKLVYDIAATWLALGLDPGKVIFFRQSDIPELFELTWILACFTSKGLLNRAHAYKAAVEENNRAGRLPDTDINAGLFNYPVLMSADILLYGSEVVPVGLDQKQHLEITRDIASAFNQNYGRVLTLPEPLIQETVMTIPGIDGRKMSKNYGNTIPIFAGPDIIHKQVMRIVSDSKHPQDPKNPDECNIFAIYRYFAAPKRVETRRKQYLEGGLAYSEVKQELFELLEDTFGDKRDRYDRIRKDPAEIDRIFRQGAQKARTIGSPNLERVRKAIGIR